MSNPGATGKFYWTSSNAKGPASEPVELVAPDGTLCGVTLRTLVNGWGNYQDRTRDEIGRRILNALNNTEKIK